MFHSISYKDGRLFGWVTHLWTGNFCLLNHDEGRGDEGSLSDVIHRVIGHGLQKVDGFLWGGKWKRLCVVLETMHIAYHCCPGVCALGWDRHSHCTLLRFNDCLSRADGNKLVNNQPITNMVKYCFSSTETNHLLLWWACADNHVYRDIIPISIFIVNSDRESHVNRQWHLATRLCQRLNIIRQTYITTGAQQNEAELSAPLKTKLWWLIVPAGSSADIPCGVWTEKPHTYHFFTVHIHSNTCDPFHVP